MTVKETIAAILVLPVGLAIMLVLLTLVHPSQDAKRLSNVEVEVVK